jgi:hypothetical protein
MKFLRELLTTASILSRLFRLKGMLWLLLLTAQDLPAPSQIIDLRTELGHVQGIEVSENRLWVTDVDMKNKRGYLRLFSLPDGELLKTVDVTDGERYHPGGIAGTTTDLWVPVAEYRRDSSAVIQRRDKRTLDLVSSFPVQDHIGAVAVFAGRLVGANWDARKIFSWNFAGKELHVRENPLGTAYQDWKFPAMGTPLRQDWKFQGITLLGGGILDGEGVLDWIDSNSWTLKKRLKVGRTDRGVRFTQEGMTFRKGKLYLLPEDGRSRLFVFQLPE